MMKGMKSAWRWPQPIVERCRKTLRRRLLLMIVMRKERVVVDNDDEDNTRRMQNINSSLPGKTAYERGGSSTTGQATTSPSGPTTV
jgi:hypothetical protein